nr:unnamed protein product [Callosobruchus chinensis]
MKNLQKISIPKLKKEPEDKNEEEISDADIKEPDVKEKQPPQKKIPRNPEYVAAVNVCLGALGTGTIMGWTNNIMFKLQSGCLHGMQLSEDQVSWSASFMAIGAMLVCIPTGILLDTIGRKPTVLLASIPFYVGWACIIFAKFPAMLYAGRFFCGFAGASFCVSAPLYTSEIAERDIRGRLGAFFQLFYTLGMLYAVFFGWAFPIILFNYACAIAYNMRRQRPDKAARNLARLRHKDHDCTGELQRMQNRLAPNLVEEKFMTAFKNRKSVKKATWVCMMLTFFQQWSGVSGVLFYSNRLFTLAGAGLYIPEHWTVILQSCFQVLGATFVMWTVDRFGRKPLLIFSSSMMALSSASLGVFFSLMRQDNDDEYVSRIAFFPIISCITFVVGYSMGMGPIPWLLPTELFPPHIKATGCSIIGVFSWFLLWLISSMISLSGIAFVLFVVPETNQKSFDDILEELEVSSYIRSKPSMK